MCPRGNPTQGQRLSHSDAGMLPWMLGTVGEIEAQAKVAQPKQGETTHKALDCNMKEKAQTER